MSFAARRRYFARGPCEPNPTRGDRRILENSREKVRTWNSIEWRGGLGPSIFGLLSTILQAGCALEALTCRRSFFRMRFSGFSLHPRFRSLGKAWLCRRLPARRDNRSRLL